MDDDMENEIICELFTTHLHLAWRSIAITSRGIADKVLPNPGESFKSKIVEPGPCLLLVLIAVVLSIVLQSSSQLMKHYICNINQVLGIDKVVSGSSLKSFVSSTINPNSISEEFCEGIVGVFAMQGRRGNMEDRFSIYQNVDVGANKKMSFYGVYDGHGGQFVAEYVKENLFKSTIEKLQNLHSDQTQSSSNGEKKESNNNYKSTTRNSFSKPNPNRRTSTKESAEGNAEDNSEKSSESKNGSNTPETIVIGRRPSQDQKMNEINKYKFLTRRASSTEDGPSTDTKDKKPSPEAEIENLSDKESPTKTEPKADASVSMKKDDPYTDKNLLLKRNSFSVNKENPTPKEKTETNVDSIYFDSHRNINYTRLLTDQILAVDSKIVEHCKSCTDMSGSTAVVAVLDGEMLIIGNVGDSRAVMGDIKGMTIPLSFDHKPNQLKERRRIKEAGGFISFVGVWRVAGILATSRALGDFPLKDPRHLVTAEPDVLTFSLREHKAQFVILATDGLWDVMSNEEAVNFVREHLYESDYGARSLAQRAYDLGSQDNITVTILNLSKLSL